jgi:hypothetical protein
MSARGDRSIQTGLGPVLALSAILFAAAGAGGYFWYRSAVLPAESPSQQKPQEETSTAGDSGATHPVTLFVPVSGKLEQVAAEVRRLPEAQLEMRDAAMAVLSDDEAARSPVLGALTLRALYFDRTGTVVVDLAPKGRKEPAASAGEELLAIYALVNTMFQNFPEVRQVRFIVDGREAATLAGHVDLSRSYVKRTDLVRTP